MLNEQIKITNKLKPNEKDFLLFILNREELLYECIVTNKDLKYELSINDYQLKKVISNLTDNKLIKVKKLCNTYSGNFSKRMGIKNFINPTGLKKLLTINKVILIEFLNKISIT